MSTDKMSTISHCCISW